MYFNESIPSHPKDIHQFFDKWSSTKKMSFTALMTALAVILQAAGGLLPGIGYFFSPFATAPILLAALISFRSGVSTYLLTSCLLLLIQPSELIIFPFTTGLLGLGLGWTFCKLNRRFGILIVNGLLLLLGACIPLYVFGFPLFGPVISPWFNIQSMIGIFGFSLIYSWLWLEFGLFLLRKINMVLELK